MTDHKEVWVCEVEADDATIAAHLGGKRRWLVGSTCGPELMLLTDAIWGQQFPTGFWEQATKDLTRRVRLAFDATRAISETQTNADDYTYRDSVVRGLEG